MFFRKTTLAIVAALVTVLTGSAFAYPWERPRTRGYVSYPVYSSYPVYDSRYYNYNDRNIYKTNRSSYSRYPSSSYYSYPTYSYPSNNRYYNNGYYNNGYYLRDRYYNDGPSLQLGPVRIDF